MTYIPHTQYATSGGHNDGFARQRIEQIEEENRLLRQEVAELKALVHEIRDALTCETDDENKSSEAEK